MSAEKSSSPEEVKLTELEKQYDTAQKNLKQLQTTDLLFTAELAKNALKINKYTEKNSQILEKITVLARNNEQIQNEIITVTNQTKQEGKETERLKLHYKETEILYENLLDLN